MSYRRNWIQQSVRKPGALRQTVMKRYGKKGFTKKGTIQLNVLDELSQEPGKTGERARFAKTVRKF